MNTSRFLTCQQLVELVTDYLEHALTTDDLTSVEHHLRICQNCAAYLTHLHRTVEITTGLLDDPVPTDAVPAEMIDQLMIEFRRRHRQ